MADENMTEEAQEHVKHPEEDVKHAEEDVKHAEEAAQVDSEYAYSDHERSQGKKKKRNKAHSIRDRPEWTRRFVSRNYDKSLYRRQRKAQGRHQHDDGAKGEKHKSHYDSVENLDETEYTMDESLNRSIDLPPLDLQDHDVNGDATNKLSISEILDIKPHGQGVYAVPPFPVSYRKAKIKNNTSRSDGTNDMVCFV